MRETIFHDLLVLPPKQGMTYLEDGEDTVVHEWRPVLLRRENALVDVAVVAMINRGKQLEENMVCVLVLQSLLRTGPTQDLL